MPKLGYEASFKTNYTLVNYDSTPYNQDTEEIAKYTEGKLYFSWINNSSDNK
jgi:hypothetical protein